MKRSLENCADCLYDLVIIGGGIHGAAIAYHGSRAGFSTLLLEKQDFSGGTSANSLKILHGGLRYLQHMDVKRMRQSIRSRREIMRLAPHLVQPLACLMPAYGHGIRGKEVMRFALLLNDLIGWDRNRGVGSDICLPGGRTIDRKSCLAVVPGLKNKNLHGGIVWHDALSMNTERVVLEYILAAVGAGADAANYAEVTKLALLPNGSSELTVQDKISDEIYCIRGKVVVNAAGPWLDHVLENVGIITPRITRYAMALNIIVNRPIFSDYAVALEGRLAYDDHDAIFKRGKRFYFFVPWRGSTMIGTNYRICTQSPDSFSLRREDIHTMVDEVNRIYRSAELGYGDVTFYHSGLLPMSDRAEREDGSIHLEKHSRIIDYAQSGFPGLLSVKSVKYTTAPSLAWEVIERVSKKVKPSLGNGVVGIRERKSKADDGLQRVPCMEYLRRKYGGQAVAVSRYLGTDEGCGAWISTDPPLLQAEVEYCIAEEMAVSLEDIIMRRTDLGTVQCPPPDVLNRLASFVAEIQGWSRQRERDEINRLISRYAVLDHYDREWSDRVLKRGYA